MFQTLLTPFSSRFAQSARSPGPQSVPSSSTGPEELAPEDFARDVLIEVMRNSVDSLKVAEGLKTQMEVLSEIQRILRQDACTKDVFREMDGFLSLLNVLATIQPGTQRGSFISEDQYTDSLRVARLAFRVLSDAMEQHDENAHYFQHSIGYESLHQSLSGLLADSASVRRTLGCLLALAMGNWDLSTLFEVNQTDYAALNQDVLVVEAKLRLVRHPEALRILFKSVPPVSARQPALRYLIYRTLERISHASHRNHCALSSLGIVGHLFTDFCEGKDKSDTPKQERQIVQKLLRRLVDVGLTTDEARTMFHKAAHEDESLDPEVLEILRAGMKLRWPEHFSLESGAALRVSADGVRGLPTSGFTSMTWVWIEKFPMQGEQLLFSFRVGTSTHIALTIQPDSTLTLRSNGSKDVASFKYKLGRTRWTHVAMVHHPHRAAQPTVRLFVDGVLVDSVNWSYPRAENHPGVGTYLFGDPSSFSDMSWCIASAYVLSIPLANHVPRFVHHLGPRYTARFQAADLIKFLTYEASTALNIHISTGVSQQPAAPDVTALVQAVKSGIDIPENSILFTISPSANIPYMLEGVTGVSRSGDIFVVNSTPLDLVMWKLGGAAVPLRLVQFANNQHELSRSLGILTDGLRNSWQNSEDIERFRGYEILAQTLRTKSHHINVTAFETLFEFLGLNFRSPDHSTIVNTIAYRAIALDFQLWSSTREEIQQAHLEQFSTLLQASKHKRFNAKQRIAKMSVVRKILFALQTSWYSPEMVPLLVGTLRVVAEAHFSVDDAIKPIVSYLAANLHEVDASGPGTSSPRSIVSRIDYNNARSKAEQVLGALIDLLSSPPSYTKFTAALPLPRICLLLLGDHPSPATAIQILRLVGVSLDASLAFSRKFELVSGWGALKVALPHAWDSNVQTAVFDLLLGRRVDGMTEPPAVSCPQIVPAIFHSLKVGLDTVAGQVVNGVFPEPEEITRMEIVVEHLLEELIEVHSSAPTFRQVFKSHATTQSFIDAFRSFVAGISMFSSLSHGTVRILEKMSHLGLSVALDNVVSTAQKEEIMEVLQSAETALNPGMSQDSAIDAAAVVGHRLRHRKRGSLRLSVQLSESTVKRSQVRIHNWRKTVIATEKKRLRKTVLDLREHHRQIAALTDWAGGLTAERGLWAPSDKRRFWQLDETEGPYRVRKRLEPARESSPSSKIDTNNVRNGSVYEADTSSLPPLHAPWHDSYDMSSPDVDDHQLDEVIVDDKHRRVRHELQPGDVIEAASTVARVSGIDSYPGLLIFGRTHLYILDGLIEDESGEIIDAHDAPKKLFFVPGSNVALDGPQRAQRWGYDQIVSFSDRTFLFRDVGLEVYFRDSRSLLVVFVHKRQRQDMTSRLSVTVNSNSTDTLTPGLVPTGPPRSPLVGRLGATFFGAKVLTGLKLDELSTAQRRWETREISNFTYLSILNQISGRTPNDATQYPVFPWVLADYGSSILDLTAPKTFRDLSKPMGALNPARQESAQSRYINLQSVGEKPFHYGTHFSSSMIVCHFLIRLEPFSHMFKTLQGGDWDLPDRLFSDIKRSWESASHDVRGDVRELIPEFFACPEFLENLANYDFGVHANTGERIHDVKLPPWAMQDPLLFIMRNREALESSYVSEHLPEWIDLIWGCKQRDPEALNVFHPLSYEGSIDLDSITDDLEREATVGIIHNFGQTPRKLFHTPHPPRIMHGTSSLPLGTLYGIIEDHPLIAQIERPVRELGPGNPVREIVYDTVGQRVIPCTEGVLCVPSRPYEQIEWDCGESTTGTMKVIVDRKVTQVIESTFCSCAAFADSDTLATGSLDHTVRLWHLSRGHGAYAARTQSAAPSIVLTHIMRAHTAEVTCVAASRAWSLVVSGSKDGSAAIWDLNRGVYVRSIWHGPGDNTEVHLVAVNESTGYIATCSRSKLLLHTINARPIAAMDLPTNPLARPPITVFAFLEREYARMGILATGAGDGSIVLRTWNADGTPEGERARWEFVTVRVLKAKGAAEARRGSVQEGPSITALKFVGETLYHGEDTGKTYVWTLPD